MNVEKILQDLKHEDELRFKKYLLSIDNNIYYRKLKNKKCLQKKYNNSQGPYTGSGYYLAIDKNDKKFIKRYHTKKRDLKKVANKKVRKYQLGMSNGSYYKKLLDIHWLIT